MVWGGDPQVAGHLLTDLEHGWCGAGDEQNEQNEQQRVGMNLLKMVMYLLLLKEHLKKMKEMVLNLHSNIRNTYGGRNPLRFIRKDKTS